MPPGDPFGDMMNGPAKYVVSRTLEKPIWRNTTIIRDDVVGAVRALKASPGGTIVTDGSSQLVHTLIANDLVDRLHLLVYPLILGTGKRVFPEGVHAPFTLQKFDAVPDRRHRSGLRPRGVIRRRRLRTARTARPPTRARCRQPSSARWVSTR